METGISKLLVQSVARLAFLVTLCVSPPTAAAQDRGVTAEQVRTSIERATRYLIQQQKADGSWPERPRYADGLTPLCTLALLHISTCCCSTADRTSN